MQQNKSTLSALGHTISDDSTELLYIFTVSQYCRKVQVFLTVPIAVTSDMIRERFTSFHAVFSNPTIGKVYL